MSWSHYKFGLRAKSVFLREGKEIVSPDERYTTMCCGACGVLNKKHSNERWTCAHCGTFHLRDPAASRCIFIKPLAVAMPAAAAAATGAVAVAVAATGLPVPMEVDDDVASGQLQPTNAPLTPTGGGYGSTQ